MFATATANGQSIYLHAHSSGASMVLIFEPIGSANAPSYGHLLTREQATSLANALQAVLGGAPEAHTAPN